MDSLKRRLDAAIHYLEENERTMVVVQAAEVPGEDISEADAMEQYLIEQSCGKSDQRKISQTVSTRENLSFQSEFIDRNMRPSRSLQIIFIVTGQNFSRTGRICSCFSVSTSSNYVFQINYLVREFLRFWQFLKNKRIL